MQREDIILGWTFLPYKLRQKFKPFVEKVSDLIIKIKLRLNQLARINPEEIVVPFTKMKLANFGKTRNLAKKIVLFCGKD